MLGYLELCWARKVPAKRTLKVLSGGLEQGRMEVQTAVSKDRTGPGEG